MLGRELRIKLDGGNEQTFWPSAPVHGILTYKASGNDRLTSVSLDLRGVIKVSPSKTGSSAAGNAKRPQTEHIELFHIFEKILPEPIFTEGRTLTWTFTIVLPDFTGPDRSNDVYVDSGNQLFEEMPHRLPPSLGADQSGEVEIVYHMYAVALRRGIRGYGLTEQLQEAPVVYNLPSLLYYPDPPVNVDESIPKVDQEWELVPIIPKQGRFSLKRSATRDSTNLAMSQSLVKTMNVKSPAMIVIGKNINIVLSIPAAEDAERSASASQIPLKTLSVSLRALTHRRTRDTPHTPALTETLVMKLGPELSKGYRLTSESPLSLSVHTDAVSTWPPTFKSYSVARTYELVIEATISKGKESFKSLFATEVEVFRKLGHQDLERRESATLPELPALGPRGDEALPAYHR